MRSTLGLKGCISTKMWTTRSLGSSFWTPSWHLVTLAMMNVAVILKNVLFASWSVFLSLPSSSYFSNLYYVVDIIFLSKFKSWFLKKPVDICAQLCILFGMVLIGTYGFLTYSGMEKETLMANQLSIWKENKTELYFEIMVRLLIMLKRNWNVFLLLLVFRSGILIEVRLFSFSLVSYLMVGSVHLFFTVGKGKL